jgi:tetratricopeptide (TPR) repeat protein
LAVAVVLLAVMAGGALAYRAAGDSAYQLGVSAMAKGDCATAIDRFRSVTTVYEFTFSSDVARADAGIEECLAFQAAEDIQGGGDYEAAVAAFRSFEEANPDSALVPVARDRQAATFVAWGSELVAAGSFEEAIDRFETVALELDGSEPATEARKAEAAAYASWGDALAAEGEFEEAVAKYDVADEEFADTPAADSAHTAAAATYVAWGERLVANQAYAEGIDKYRAAAQDYEGTPASEDAQTALDDLLQSAIGDIDTVRACISRRTLDAFVEAEVDAKQARNSLAPALYHCGLTQMDVVNYDLALAEFDRLLDDFPNSQLVDETKIAVIDARVAKYHAESDQEEFGTPQRIGSAPAGTVVFEYQNDSPDKQELLFSGPTSSSIVVDPCPSCVRYDEGQEPAFCPEKGPKETVTLTPGTYTIASLAPDEASLQTSVDTWTLTSGSKYYLCVIVFVPSG